MAASVVQSEAVRALLATYNGVMDRRELEAFEARVLADDKALQKMLSS
jgi:hypothetical protein